MEWRAADLAGAVFEKRACRLDGRWGQVRFARGGSGSLCLPFQLCCLRAQADLGFQSKGKFNEGCNTNA